MGAWSPTWTGCRGAACVAGSVRGPPSRVAPFKKLAKTIRTQRDGILAWTKLRVTNGALEGMNNQVKAISHRAFGFRTTWTYIANIYHCCAALPLP
jgi:transposase